MSKDKQIINTDKSLSEQERTQNKMNFQTVWKHLFSMYPRVKYIFEFLSITEFTDIPSKKTLIRFLIEYSSQLHKSNITSQKDSGKHLAKKLLKNSSDDKTDEEFFADLRDDESDDDKVSFSRIKKSTPSSRNHGSNDSFFTCGIDSPDTSTRVTHTDSETEYKKLTEIWQQLKPRHFQALADHFCDLQNSIEQQRKVLAYLINVLTNQSVGNLSQISSSSMVCGSLALRHLFQIFYGFNMHSPKVHLENIIHMI